MIWNIVIAANAAPAADLALATEASAGVTYRAPSGAADGLLPFSKVRQGDVIHVPDGGSLQLMYFSDGHSETFVGPLELVVGGDTKPVARAEGDVLVGEALRSLPALVRRAELDKGGHTLVRGARADTVPLDADEQAEIDAAVLKHQVLRKDAAADDVVPELYLATVYLSFGQEPSAIGVLEGAVARCATCSAPRSLLAALQAAP